MAIETRPAVPTLPKENLGIVKESIARDIHVNFLDDALGEGANLELPKGVVQDYWIRDQIITAEYYRNGKLMHVLGLQYGLTRSRIQQVLRETLTRLWRNTSPSLQEKYPLHKLIVTGKSREKREERPIPKVDIYEIAKKTGVCISDTRKVLEVLRQEGIVIPNPFSLQDIVGRLKEENDDKKAQELLDEIPSAMSIVNYINGMKLKGEPCVFAFLGIVFREKDIHVPFVKFLIVDEFLRSINIPTKRVERKDHLQNYWIVLTRDAERIAREVRGNPDFQKFTKNPVKIIYGGSTRSSSVPGIGELSKGQKDQKGRYAKVAKFLLTRFGLGPATYRKYRELFNNSPVPIYQARSIAGLFFTKEDEGILVPFLEKRFKELGIKIEGNHNRVWCKTPIRLIYQCQRA